MIVSTLHSHRGENLTPDTPEQFYYLDSTSIIGGLKNS
jgi:hypothetical protein